MWSAHGHIWSHLDVVDADAAVGEEAVLGALATDLSAGKLREEVGHRRVPVAQVLERTFKFKSVINKLINLKYIYQFRIKVGVVGAGDGTFAEGDGGRAQ